jgi:hypothetical protein
MVKAKITDKVQRPCLSAKINTRQVSGWRSCESSQIIFKSWRNVGTCWRERDHLKGSLSLFLSAMSSGFQQTSQDENERDREGSRSKRMQKSKIESNMGVLRCSAWGVRE